MQRLGWFNKNSGGTTRSVRQLAPNAWGFYDLHGNVLEWCADFWSERYEGRDEVDPTGLPDGSSRVIRGGCWNYQAQNCRSAFRYWRPPSVRRLNLGFRLAAGLVSPASGKEQAR